MKPITYQDWRRIYQGALMNLGLHTEFLLLYGHRRGFQVTKGVWVRLHRIKRLRKRLDAECEACTGSFLEAIVDAFGLEDEQ